MLPQSVIRLMLEQEDELWFVQEDMAPVLRDRSLIQAVPDLAPHELLKRCAPYA